MARVIVETSFKEMMLQSNRAHSSGQILTSSLSIRSFKSCLATNDIFIDEFQNWCLVLFSSRPNSSLSKSKKITKQLCDMMYNVQLKTF